jgi:hypothetical protein
MAASPDRSAAGRLSDKLRTARNETELLVIEQAQQDAFEIIEAEIRRLNGFHVGCRRNASSALPVMKQELPPGSRLCKVGSSGRTR